MSTTASSLLASLPDVLVITRDNLHAIDIAALPEGGALLLIDKPPTWTSFDVVAKVRRASRVKKVGHSGTLDPMATGLLVLCLGRATKLADRIQAGLKEYAGTIRFGATTDTDDAEGVEQEHYTTDHLTPDMVRNAAQTFVGESMQIPPMFSARKVQGKRLYELARKGQKVDIPAKPITVYEFDITAVRLPEIDVRIVCSKGTYIRSLARDLGRAVSSGAYLSALRRLRSGSFDVHDAVTVEMIQQTWKREVETQPK